MFTATPVPSFSAKITAGRVCGLFLLSPANSNSAGNQFNRRPGNESEEALSNGESLQGAEKHSGDQQKEERQHHADERECGAVRRRLHGRDEPGKSDQTRHAAQCDESLHSATSIVGFEQIGAPVERIVSRLKEKAGREAPGEEVRNLPASNTAQGARRAVNS